MLYIKKLNVFQSIQQLFRLTNVFSCLTLPLTVHASATQISDSRGLKLEIVIHHSKHSVKVTVSSHGDTVVSSDSPLFAHLTSKI